MSSLEIGHLCRPMAQEVSPLECADSAQLPCCAGPATSIIESMTNRVTRPKPIQVQDRSHTVSSKCGFATLFDPHGGRPASAGLGALNASAIGITLGSVIEKVPKRYPRLCSTDRADQVSNQCISRFIVIARFGIVTAEFGHVTGRFGQVTDGHRRRGWVRSALAGHSQIDAGSPINPEAPARARPRWFSRPPTRGAHALG
jgi:hypothetical protein